VRAPGGVEAGEVADLLVGQWAARGRGEHGVDVGRVRGGRRATFPCRQTEGVHHDVPLPTVDLPGVVPAALGADGVRTLDRLGIDHPGRDHRIPARVDAHPVPEPIMNAVHGAVGVPPGE